jgi:hypothetical protein
MARQERSGRRKRRAWLDLALGIRPDPGEDGENDPKILMDVVCVQVNLASNHNKEKDNVWQR